MRSTNAEDMTDAEIDKLLDRFDQTEPGLQRRIIAQFVINSLVSQQEAELSQEAFHQLMGAVKNSRMEHGDCKSGKRYGGIPKACTACMANLRIEEMVAAYKGRMVRLA